MIITETFGCLPNGQAVTAYTLKNDSGAYVKILNYGGIINQLCVPDRNGELADVVCGYDTIDGYLTAGGYQGALIGRFGNRIGNARFTLDGEEYILYKNDGDNHLHGGAEGFDKKIWTSFCWEYGGTIYLVLKCKSPDGEEGYPGDLYTKVIYSFTSDNKLIIDYVAHVEKKATVLNLTNHAYFNMAGYNGGSIENQLLYVNADYTTEVGDGLIPTGNLLSVENTPYDFREAKLIGRDINADDPCLILGKGYDHNFVLNADGSVIHAATITDPVSGRGMKVYTDQPCMQVYTANAINEDDAPFKGNIPQKKRCAVCFETQHAPDAVNHPEFVSAVLRPGEKYQYTTIFEFFAEK